MTKSWFSTIFGMMKVKTNLCKPDKLDYIHFTMVFSTSCLFSMFKRYYMMLYDII